ncbi:hypothetical protein [Planctobacterium marinum]|uniref:hypothetical protein n=1 Tax=Planctobacterium marinum TaxID=1631968 RepID=UPI001E56C318|nr:hypothetical protein [Planctobacterium marinum]MCC2606265.1 hypothetical protein [Planctobacterium marinum]
MKTNIPKFSDREPDSLRQNSDAIKSVLMAEELDAEKLQEVVEAREKLIVSFLQDNAAVDKTLLQELLRTNNELTTLVNGLKNEQQDVLVGFLRNRKAVKKYKK